MTNQDRVREAMHNQLAKAESNEIEIMPLNAVQEITKGEIDIQISTAHRFPRSLDVFNKRASDMITMDEETAESCIYNRPVGKENGIMKYASGKSVRMAEIVGASYGNLRAGAMLVEQTDRIVKARGFAHDLESNFAASTEVVESTVDRNGRPYSERMRVVVAKAALAKARRDATFQVVPSALCKKLEKLAMDTAIGKGTTLEMRRGRVIEWITKLGIDLTRVFAALNIQGAEDIGTKQLETLTGLKTAIKDGDTTVEEAFPEIGQAEQKAIDKKNPEKKNKKPESKTKSDNTYRARIDAAADQGDLAGLAAEIGKDKKIGMAEAAELMEHLNEKSGKITQE